MAGADKHELGFFLLQYMPDELKGEFVNIGLVLVGDGADAGYADVRFTRDWRRVLCLDPGADLEWLQALESLVKKLIERRAMVRELILEFRASSRRPFPRWAEDA